MDMELLRGHGWARISRNDQAVHRGVPGHVAQTARASLSSRPLNGAGLPARIAKGNRKAEIVPGDLRLYYMLLT